MNLPNPTYLSFFPSHLIDPNLKGKQWFAQYCQAAYNAWVKNQYVLQRRADWISNRKYADGNQTTQKYMDMLARVKDNEGRRATYLNLDWSIVSTIPKIRRVVINFLLKLNYDIIATAVNPEAVNAKETVKIRTWAEKQLQPFLAQVEAQSGVPLTNPELDIIPEVREEFEMLFSMTYKMAEEMKIELATKHILDKNRFNDIHRKNIEDAFDLGLAASKVETNIFTKEIDVRYVDPVNLLFDNFRGKTGGMGDGDIERIAELRAVTIAQLKQEAGSQFTDEEYEQIAAQAQNSYNQPFAPNNATQPYVNTDANFGQWQNYQVVIMDIYFISTDRYKMKKVKSSDGEMVYQKGFNAKLGKNVDYKEGQKVEKEIYPVDIVSVYKTSWLINTNYVYNYGKMYDIPRDKRNPRECSLPIKIYRSDNKSILESILPFADAIQLSWLKLQNLKATALPKGLMINLEAWDNVMVDGKIKSTEELFQMATETGIVLYRGTSTMDESGRITGKPIEELDGGLGRQFTEIIADLDYNMRMIYEVSGINEVMAASNPNPNMLSGVAKQAVSSSENSLGSILDAVTNIHERLATDISLKLQIMLKDKTIGVYDKALGKIIEVGEEVSPMTFGIALEPLPTEQQRRKMEEMIMSSVINPNNPTTGGLFVDDAIPLITEIYSGVNLKVIMRKYSYLLKKRRDEFMANEQMKIKTQSDGIVQQTQASTEGQMQMLQYERETKLAVIQAEAEAQIRVFKETQPYRNEQTIVRSETKKGEKAFEASLPPK